MLAALRAARGLVFFFIITAGSAVMFWNHVNRAVSEGGLCRAVEKHVAKLSASPDGSIANDTISWVESIGDQCEQRFSKHQARCVLKATSIAAVRACN